MLQFRLLSGTALIAIFGLVVFWPSPIASALFVLVSSVFLVGAVTEFYGLIRAVGYAGNSLLTSASGLVLVVAVGAASISQQTTSANYNTFENIIVCAFVIAAAVCEIVRRDIKVGVFNFLLTLGGFLYVVWSMLPMAKIYFLNSGGNGGGPYLFFFMILVTKFADIGGYVFGKLTNARSGGNHKLIPAVSPGKSWEGLFGGFVFSVGAACVLVSIMGSKLTITGGRLIGYSDAVILGLLLTTAGLIGDLSVSLLKRAADQKDSGSIIPGMGGVLDVVDSLLFASPCFYCYVTIVMI